MSYYDNQQWSGPGQNNWEHQSGTSTPVRSGTSRRCVASPELQLTNYPQLVRALPSPRMSSPSPISSMVRRSDHPIRAARIVARAAVLSTGIPVYHTARLIRQKRE